MHLGTKPMYLFGLIFIVKHITQAAPMDLQTQGVTNSDFERTEIISLPGKDGSGKSLLDSLRSATSDENGGPVGEDPIEYFQNPESNNHSQGEQSEKEQVLLSDNADVVSDLLPIHNDTSKTENNDNSELSEGDGTEWPENTGIFTDYLDKESSLQPDDLDDEKDGKDSDESDEDQIAWPVNQGSSSDVEWLVNRGMPSDFEWPVNQGMTSDIAGIEDDDEEDDGDSGSQISDMEEIKELVDSLKKAKNLLRQLLRKEHSRESSSAASGSPSSPRANMYRSPRRYRKQGLDFRIIFKGPIKKDMTFTITVKQGKNRLLRKGLKGELSKKDGISSNHSADHPTRPKNTEQKSPDDCQTDTMTDQQTDKLSSS